MTYYEQLMLAIALYESWCRSQGGNEFSWYAVSVTVQQTWLAIAEQQYNLHIN